MELLDSNDAWYTRSYVHEKKVVKNTRPFFLEDRIATFYDSEDEEDEETFYLSEASFMEDDSDEDEEFDYAFMLKDVRSKMRFRCDVN